MQVLVSFRHMEPSDALRSYAEDKLTRVVRKYIPEQSADAQVTLKVEKFRHIANFHVHYKNLSIKSEEASDDMYSSIDIALDKLERQVRRYKDKLRNHKPASGRDRGYRLAVIAPYSDAELEAVYAENVAAAEAAAAEAARENFLAQPEPVPEVPEEVQILKRETRSAKPMSVDEAVMQLDLEQDTFIVFTNAETQQINILYRRKDGYFGLIETS